MIRRVVKARPIPPKVLLGILIAVGAGIFIWFAVGQIRKPVEVNSFEACVAAGNPVLESYPEQCVHNGQSFFRPDQATPHPYEVSN